MTRTLSTCLLALAACGGGGTGGPDARGPGGGDGGAPAEVAGCDGASLYAVPADPAEPGPWPVGARTVTVGRLTAEVWYPAPLDATGTPIRYDIRDALPESQRSKISDEDNPWQPCDCARDLPLDGDHGPYPVVIFIHGTASFRTQSLLQVTHWASRGFVVVAADHPGLTLADSLALACPDPASGDQDLAGDVSALLDALAGADGDLAFLAGRVALDRVGLAGHSAGGNAVAGLGDVAGVRVIIPMAASAATAGDLDAILYLGGQLDAVVAYSQTQGAYEGSARPRRLVGLADSGHLAFSDLCELRNAAGQDMVEIAQDNGVCGAQLASFLFDCDDAYLDAATADRIIDHTTSAVLEPALHCAEPVSWSDLQTRYPAIAELREDL
jgi:hypothetical protein